MKNFTISTTGSFGFYANSASRITAETRRFRGIFTLTSPVLRRAGVVG